MKLANLRFLPKVMGLRDRVAVISFIAGIPVCLVLYHFHPLQSVITQQIVTPLIGGVISIALILSSIVSYSAAALREKRYIIPLLSPLALIILAVLLAAGTYLSTRLFYFASYYLLLGISLFIIQILVIMSEETVGATLWEKATYESRGRKEPHLGDESSICKGVFGRKIHVCKGDTILGVCDFIQDGRVLGEKIAAVADYMVYISADRPYTVIEKEFKGCCAKLYCIDCFTSVYGLGEFAQADRGTCSYTPDPPTIRGLHLTLREIRRRIVSDILFHKDLAQSRLSKIERVRLEKELVSKKAKAERKKNVWIVYDSISSLAAIFDLEALLAFLIHDTNVDKTIGRNTLLLMKNGAIAPGIASRLESFCEHIMDIRLENTKIHVRVSQSIDMTSSKDFYITI